VEAGWKLGEEVALKIIEKAKQDGSALVWDGKMNKDPKEVDRQLSFRYHPGQLYTHDASISQSVPAAGAS
jgi:hypothetical protein